MQELFDTQILTRLAEEIERHRQHVKTIPDRHARLFALKEAIKLIAKLQKIIHATSLSAAPAFRDSLKRLGEHLSSQAIEELAGSVAWMIDERAIVHAFERRGRGDVHFMDRLTRVTRQVVSVKIGPKLLTGLLDRLKAPPWKSPSGLSEAIAEVARD